MILRRLARSIREQDWNAVWEIQDLFYDWETITAATIAQLDKTRESLDRRLGEEPLP